MILTGSAHHIQADFSVIKYEMTPDKKYIHRNYHFQAALTAWTATVNLLL